MVAVMPTERLKMRCFCRNIMYVREISDITSVCREIDICSIKCDVPLTS